MSDLDVLAARVDRDAVLCAAQLAIADAALQRAEEAAAAGDSGEEAGR